MPFKSAKQRRYLYAEKPEVAKKFAMDSAKKGKMAKLKRGGPQDRGQEANKTGPYAPGAVQAVDKSTKTQTANHKKTISKNTQTPTGGTVTGSGSSGTTSDREFYKGPPRFPTLGPGTWAANKILGWAAPKAYDAQKKKKEKFARKEGLYRDFYRAENKPLKVMDPKNKGYMKEAGYKRSNKVPITESRDEAPRCLDGSLPPCIKPKAPIPKKETVKKSSSFLNDFKAYNKGGGVPYGPPPLRGPNPQVPPVKFSRGGGAAIRGTKFTGVK